MKRCIYPSSIFVLFVFMTVQSSVVKATPYASGIQLNGSSSTFILNEGGANVSIVYNGGATVVDLGTLAAGTHTFNANLGYSWQIVCSKNTPAEWTQISDDNLPENQYYCPSGIAVNRNFSSSNFGRIYVSNALAGAVTAVPNGRWTDKGLFVMGADESDILNHMGIPESGSIDWDAASRESFFKLTIAPDDSVYISDWSDTHSGLWRSNADPQVTFDEILENLGRDTSGLCLNHGSIASTWIEGTGANTVLYTLDEDWPDALGPYGVGRGDILRYNIGTGTSVSDVPTIQVEDKTNSAGNPSGSGLIVNGLMDLVRDEDGSWWVTQYRWSETADAPSLLRFLDGATGPIYNSGADDNLPILMVSYGNIDIHNDLDMLVMGAGGGYGVYLLDISDPANPALLETIPQDGYTSDVAFDAAGNVYIVNRTTQTLRIWSPGGNSITKTGSDGSFFLRGEIAPPMDSADFNGDGDVDESDFLIWQQSYLISAGGDADHDGDTDVDDFLVWQLQSNALDCSGTLGGSNAMDSAVPEPTSIVLLLSITTLALARCRRRGKR